jgi:2',3'-cyclic-nucleotide 2'-phosphodiesterase
MQLISLLQMFALGIQVLTSGNHIWAKKESVDLLEHDARILRPLNYPKSCPGRGYALYKTIQEQTVAVVNIMGRVYTQSLDCPFQAMENILPEIRKHTTTIVVDFHAEATSEKIAMGWFLDGKVSAVLGTHTHIQTSDDILLPQHTAYITDVGMVGPVDSVIGMDKEAALCRFLSQMPVKLEVAKGPCIVGAVVVQIDTVTGQSIAITRILLREKI